MRRYRFLLFAGIALVIGAAPALAQVPLKDAVKLLGSTNDAVTLQARPGALTHDLYFQIEKGLTGADNKLLEEPSGQLLALPFQAATDVAPMMLAVAGAAPAGPGPVTIPLPLATVQRVTLSGPPLRRGATYKGTVVLTVANLSHRWEVTLTTAARGAVTAVPIPPLQFETWPFADHMGAFAVTLRNRSETGPYSNLHAYFEGPTTTPTKVIKSNLLTSAFSFFDDAGLERPLPLERDNSRVTLDVKRDVHVRVQRLAPGEYSGVLRFLADDTADDSEASKLSLHMHVRHHWLLPVLVLLTGSIVGWFSAKYLGAMKTARDLSRHLDELRLRADQLARLEPPRAGWSFSSESSSLALTRIRVALSQLGHIVASPMAVLTRDEEIKKRRADVELRLAKLELFRETRLKVQPEGDRRPAAQGGIGRLLRQALTLLDGPALTEAQVTEFTVLLGKLEAWSAAGTFLDEYRAVLVSRLKTRVPTAAAVAAVADEGLRKRLLALLTACPTEAVLAQATLASLEQSDLQIAEIHLLWQNRDKPWGPALATASAAGATLDALYTQVDDEFWKHLAGQQFSISVASAVQLKALNVIEIALRLPAQISATEMLRHPLRVVWTIQENGDPARTVETDGLALVQYFNAAASVSVSAILSYAGKELPVDAGKTVPITMTSPLSIAANPDYRVRKFFLSFVDLAPLAIATVFSIATAMSAEYDSTFGSYAQYLALFIWAAGAATGGNVFKQLGSGVAGGAVDSALPAKH